MMTHSSRSVRLQTIYLWRAWQSEPGQDGAAYRATLTNTAPASLDPIEAMPGLLYQESLYGEWHLLGTCTGFLREDATGERVIENRSGDQWTAESIIQGGRYRAMRGD